jgi:hypothetical protein
MLEVRRSEDRGIGKTEWLDARFTFSFGPYRDPEQIGFSDLRLLNEDVVKGGGGFPTHEHQDTEVFSYVIAGALEHRDSMGYGSVVGAGEVLTMSTGTGITHSEFNASADRPVHFFQIWMVASARGVAPRYGQRAFPDSEKRGRLRCIVAPDGRDGALPLHIDGAVHAGLFDGPEQADLALGPDRYAYVHVVRGSVTANGVALGPGDGARVRHARALRFERGQDAEVLVFDLRARELPEA